MLLIFLDTETTGLDPAKHRILEIAFKVYDSRSKRVILRYEAIIHQPDAVMAEANPKSLAVNGFTQEMLLRGKSEKSVASEIIQDLNHIGIGQKEAVFICQNPSFDRSFFLQLISTDLQTAFDWPYHWLDLASMYFTAYLEKGELNDLKEDDLKKNAIARHYLLPEEATPHRAMHGVEHLMLCYGAIFATHLLESDEQSVR
ncbi:MAG: 3'-5' exonuclease [Chlamydiales bacterium]